jgi:hypothetical protein
VNSSSAKILAQRPFARQFGTMPQPERAEVDAALAGVEDVGIVDLNSGRIAAYAWYSGIKSESVLALFRSAGTAAALKRELKTHAARAFDLPRQLVSGIAHRSSEFSLTADLDDPELGWAVAILAVASEADSDAIIGVLNPEDDPSRIASLYLLARPYIPASSRCPLIRKLLLMGDDLSQEIAIALISRWIEDEIHFGNQSLADVLREVENIDGQRVVVFGALLDFVLWRYRSRTMVGETLARIDSVTDLIESAGKRIVLDEAAVNSVLKRAGTRDLQVLAAMSHWRRDPSFAQVASARIAGGARDLLDREFAPRMQHTDAENLRDASGAEWLIDPFVQALVPDGITIEKFTTLCDGLASDALSEMTRHGTFLVDRQRAITLLVIAGRVAKRRSDEPLLRAVKEAAELLASQPRGVRMILPAEVSQRIEVELGFRIPAQ